MGIVYHANYYPWFELGRLALMEMLGMSYADCEERGLMMPLTETHCKHIRPCTFDDEITIKTRLVKLGPARCAFEYDAYKGDELIAIGKTVHAFTDITPKSVNCEKHFPDIWNALAEIAEDSKL